MTLIKSAGIALLIMSIIAGSFYVIIRYVVPAIEYGVTWLITDLTRLAIATGLVTFALLTLGINQELRSSKQ